MKEEIVKNKKLKKPKQQQQPKRSTLTVLTPDYKLLVNYNVDIIVPKSLEFPSRIVLYRIRFGEDIRTEELECMILI